MVLAEPVNELSQFSQLSQLASNAELELDAGADEAGGRLKLLAKSALVGLVLLPVPSLLPNRSDSAELPSALALGCP